MGVAASSAYSDEVVDIHRRLLNLPEHGEDESAAIGELLDVITASDIVLDAQYMGSAGKVVGRDDEGGAEETKEAAFGSPEDAPFLEAMAIAVRWMLRRYPHRRLRADIDAFVRSMDSYPLFPHTRALSLGVQYRMISAFADAAVDFTVLTAVDPDTAAYTAISHGSRDRLAYLKSHDVHIGSRLKHWYLAAEMKTMGACEPYFETPTSGTRWRTWRTVLKDPACPDRVFIAVYGLAPGNYIASVAALNGRLAVLQFLDAQSEPAIDFAASDNSAARGAARKGHLAVLEFLNGKAGVDFAAGNNHAIEWAAANGHVEVVLFLADKPGVNVDAAVANASRFGQVGVLEALEASELDVDFAANGNEAARLADARARPEVLDFLRGKPGVVIRGE